jgi:hypothetical protein
MHFVPTSSSWLNQVERWFAELTTKLLQRGVHTSVQALEADIRNWIKTWNDNPRPFVWTKTADEILEALSRQPILSTDFWRRTLLARITRRRIRTAAVTIGSHACGAKPAAAARAGDCSSRQSTVAMVARPRKMASSPTPPTRSTSISSRSASSR